MEKKAFVYNDPTLYRVTSNVCCDFATLFYGKYCNVCIHVTLLYGITYGIRCRILKLGKMKKIYI